MDRLAKDIIRARITTPTEALGRQHRRRRRRRKEYTDLMQRLAARMRQSGAAKLEATVVDRPKRH